MKRGQVWQLDFLFAIVISSITLILFVNFALEQTTSTDISDLSLQASAMSESLLTQGLPTNWDKSTVRSIGILDASGRGDTIKIESFFNMTPNEYRLLLTQRNFYHIQLLQNDLPLTIGGKNFVGFNKTDANSAITVSRFLLYEGAVTKIEVSVWK